MYAAGVPRDVFQVVVGDGSAGAALALRRIRERELFCRSSKREDVKAIEIQAFAASAEEVLPVRALLHLKDSTGIDVLSFVPMEYRFNAVRIGRQQCAAYNPP